MTDGTTEGTSEGVKCPLACGKHISRRGAIGHLTGSAHDLRDSEARRVVDEHWPPSQRQQRAMRDLQRAVLADGSGEATPIVPTAATAPVAEPRATERVHVVRELQRTRRVLAALAEEAGDVGHDGLRLAVDLVRIDVEGLLDDLGEPIDTGGGDR